MSGLLKMFGVDKLQKLAGMVKEQRRRSERARLMRKMFRGVLITFEVSHFLNQIAINSEAVNPLAIEKP